jgi:Na+/H+-dicarboxylate symporter
MGGNLTHKAGRMSDQTRPPEVRPGPDHQAPHGQAGGPLGWWQRIPLYVRVLIGLAIGIVVGLALGERADGLRDVSKLILELLKALATPLILLAILNAILNANVSGRSARRMMYLLATNTLVAIFIGLVVANTIQPGRWYPLPPATEHAAKQPYDPLSDLRAKVPTNVVRPLLDDNIIAVIVLAVVFGVALRKVRQEQMAEGGTGYRVVQEGIATAFRAVMVALLWVIEIIPIAVLCSVAASVGTKGFDPFVSLAGFVVAVILALALQAAFYLTRVRLGSWVSPARLLSGGRDALTTAFSTASSTATMPVTYRCLKDKVGVREESANMGALVGSNFNNDGTALYEALAPLFIAQAIGVGMTIPHQITIALMAVVASVGAAGIPEAGLVTMLLVFKSVGLDLEYVFLLLPVDWFLDRCRTAINVMGDMTVACLLDGKEPSHSEAVSVAPPSPQAEPVG